MKNLLYSFFQVLVALLAIPSAWGQAPPGWAWATKLGTFVPNATERNSAAGLGRDAAGNLYLLGTYVGAPVLGGTPTTNLGSSDIFLAKYNPAGTLLWLRLLQSSGSDEATALTVEPNGRCTLAGSFGRTTGDVLAFTGFGASFGLTGPALLGLPTVGGGYQALSFVASVDASGAFLWADSPSSTYGLNVNSLHRDASGNCYLSGNTVPQQAITINGQQYPAIGIVDAVLIKYTVAGQVEWARRVGASGGFSSNGTVKTDAAGAVYWSVNHNRDLLLDGRTIPFVVASNPVTQGSNTLVKISAANKVIWAKNGILKSGNTNAQFSVLAIEQSSNALYLSGGSYGGVITNQQNSLAVPVSTGSFGTCVAKCDTSGTIQWIRPFAYASTIPNGSSWAAVGIMDFFPDAAGYTALTNTAYAARTVFPPNSIFDFDKSGIPCVVRYSYSTNQFEWIRTGGLASNSGGSALNSTAVGAAVDANNNVFVAGNFTGAAVFGATTITSTSTTQQEIFLAKLDQTVLTSSRSNAAGVAWSVFPNPSPGTAQLVGLPAAARVAVHDALGRVVRELPAQAGADAPRTVAGLAPGLYLLRVSGTALPYPSQRLVVE